GVAALKFLREAHAEGAALKPIFSEVLVKAMNINRQDPREVGQAELASHSVDLIERTARGAATIVGDLPRIVDSRPTSASRLMSFFSGRNWLIPQLSVRLSPGVRSKSSFLPFVS